MFAFFIEINLKKRKTLENKRERKVLNRPARQNVAGEKEKEIPDGPSPQQQKNGCAARLLRAAKGCEKQLPLKIVH